MNKIKKENLLYRKAIPCSRLFLYSAPLELLEDEYKRKIHLFHKLGFVLSDSVPIS